MPYKLMLVNYLVSFIKTDKQQTKTFLVGNLSSSLRYAVIQTNLITGRLTKGGDKEHCHYNTETDVHLITQFRKSSRFLIEILAVSEVKIIVLTQRN